MAFLTRIDTERNLRRFYVVSVTPTLFGEWSMVREWGRIGSPGTVRNRSFDKEQEARAAEQRSIKRRLRNGYAKAAADDGFLRLHVHEMRPVLRARRPCPLD